MRESLRCWVDLDGSDAVGMTDSHLAASEHPEQWRPCFELAGGHYWERLPPWFDQVRGIKESRGIATR